MTVALCYAIPVGALSGLSGSSAGRHHHAPFAPGHSVGTERGFHPCFIVSALTAGLQRIYA